MQFSPPSHHFIPLQFKYSPHHPVLEQSQSIKVQRTLSSGMLSRQCQLLMSSGTLYHVLLFKSMFQRTYCLHFHQPQTPNDGDNMFSKTLVQNRATWYKALEDIYNHSLCSSLNVREQVSHPYRSICKIIVLYILVLTFSIVIEKTEGSGLMVANITRIQSPLNFLLNQI
jgi:hypothetical protein